MKNKQEALERLAALEGETKALRKIIEMPDAPLKITDRVNSFLDATTELSENDPEIKKYRKLHAILDHDDWICAVQRLVILCKALNEGTVLTTKHTRHYPYFLVSSGFVFYTTTYDDAGARTSSAARLCLKNSELAIHLGKKFLPEMEAVIK